MIIDIPAFWYVLAIFIWSVIAIVAVALLFDAYVHFCEYKERKNERIVNTIINDVKEKIEETENNC